MIISTLCALRLFDFRVLCVLSGSKQHYNCTTTRNSSAGDVIIFRSPAFFNTDERLGFMSFHLPLRLDEFADNHSIIYLNMNEIDATW